MNAAEFRHAVLGPDLPQVRLRRLQGRPCQSRPRARQEDSRGPRRVPGKNIFWAAPDARRMDEQLMGQVIHPISNFRQDGRDNRARDPLDRVYEYYIGEFASTEGKRTSECDVLPPVGRGRYLQGHHRGRHHGLHGGPTRTALLLDPDPAAPVVRRQSEREWPLSRPMRPGFSPSY
jgi:hypothetical protein